MDRTKFEGRHAKVVADLQNQLELSEHQNRLQATENESLRSRIEILEETINVLRDALGAHQITSQVHTAEGKILLGEYQSQQGPLNNGRNPLH